MSDLEGKTQIILDCQFSYALECNLSLSRAESFLDRVGEVDGSLSLEWDIAKSFIEVDIVNVVHLNAYLDDVFVFECVLIPLHQVFKILDRYLNRGYDVTQVARLFELTLEKRVKDVFAEVDQHFVGLEGLLACK